MGYKDLLLHLGSYPDPTPAEIIEQAACFAHAFGSHLTAVTFEIDMEVSANPLANALLGIPGIIAAEKAKSVTNARTLVATLSTVSSSHNVPASHIIERCLMSQMPDIVTGHARLHDLTMIPVGVPSGYEGYIAEYLIFGCGRPVLMLPTSRKCLQIDLDAVGIAWDASRPAARAVADALPLLRRAKSVHVVTVTQEKPLDAKRCGSELTRHLSYHGVKATFEELSAGDQSIGQVLTEYSAARSLGILVMGAYGHSRARDFILGGATSSMVAGPPLPILLSH